MKNRDGHPLVLYLKTGPDHSPTGPTRQLLERVNLADKTSKIKVCGVILRSRHKITSQYNHTLNYFLYFPGCQMSHTTCV